MHHNQPIRKVHVDQEFLGSLLEVMAKEDRVVILQAEPDDEKHYRGCRNYIVYYSAKDEDAQRLLEIHVRNNYRLHNQVVWIR